MDGQSQATEAATIIVTIPEPYRGRGQWDYGVECDPACQFLQNYPDEYCVLGLAETVCKGLDSLNRPGPNCIPGYYKLVPVREEELPG